MSMEGHIVWALIWCMTAFALGLALLALATLVARPRFSRLRPERVARGCVAALLLIVSLGLGLVALALVSPLLTGA